MKPRSSADDRWNRRYADVMAIVPAMREELSSGRTLRSDLRGRSLLTAIGLLIAIGALVLSSLPAEATKWLRSYMRWLERQGRLPFFLSFDVVEWLSNVLLFVPLAFLVAAFLTPARRPMVIPGALLLSTSIEIVQGLFLSYRVASTFDILANTLGAFLGVWLLVTISRHNRWFGEARRGRPAARAPVHPWQHGLSWHALSRHQHHHR